MKQENKYTSLELSKKLAEGGCELKSVYCQYETKREIKFRAWDKVQQKMQYDGSVRFDGAFMVADYARFMSLHPEEVGFTDNCILMQYTGLKDKNGKEIYEGDIIHSKWEEEFVGKDDSKAVVYWSNENGGWARNEKGKDTKIENYHLRFHCHPKHIKMIGNIYENPELINNK